MIILRRKVFSIYSILRDNDITINCCNGPIVLKKSSLEEVKSLFKNAKNPIEKVLVYDAYVGDTKIGIVQLSENSAVEIEFDWINLADKTGMYFVGILEHFIDLARSSRYRIFTLGLNRCSEDIINKCSDYGFTKISESELKGITILNRSL